MPGQDGERERQPPADFGEFRAYSSSLTKVEHEALHARLISKWGIGRSESNDVVPKDVHMKAKSLRIDGDVNFIEGAQYSQLDLPRDLPESEEAELRWIEEHAPWGGDVVGFFFQQHTNGHRVVGALARA